MAISADNVFGKAMTDEEIVASDLRTRELLEDIVKLTTSSWAASLDNKRVKPPGRHGRA